MKRRVISRLLILLSWTVIISSCVNMALTQRHNFKINDYELERSKWRSPHEDVFSFTQADRTHEWSDLVLDTREAVESDKLHVALKACHGSMVTASDKVKEMEVQLLRLVRHLLNSVDKISREGDKTFLINISDENIQILQTFADSGKFFSRNHLTVYDLFKEIIKPPKVAIIQRAHMLSVDVWDYIVYPFARFWQILTYVFQAIFSSFPSFSFRSETEVLNWATKFLIPVAFTLSFFMTRSLFRSVLVAGTVAMMLAYSVEVQKALAAADAERIARRTSIPSECNLDEINFVWQPWYSIKSLFSSEERCVAYYREQFKEPIISPQNIFWKVAFSGLESGMGAVGEGLGAFVRNYRKYFGALENIVMIPIGIFALIMIMALGGVSAFGGSFYLPFLGRIFSRTPVVERGGGPQAALPLPQPGDVSTMQANRDVNVHNYYYGAGHAGVPPASHEFITAGSSGASTVAAPPVHVASHQFITAGSSGASAVAAPSAAEPSADRSYHNALGGSSSPADTVAMLESTPKSSLSSKVVRSPQTWDKNRTVSDSRPWTETGSGDFVPPQKVHRMFSSGETPDNLSIRTRHHRKNSLPRDFYFGGK